MRFRRQSRPPLVFELSDGGDDTYQTLNLGSEDSPKVEEKPRRRRRLFWWLRGGWGKPNKFDELKTLERKPLWSRDWYKPLQMLTYPQGPGTCDHNDVDRAINLVTTLPFFGIAYHTYKNRRTREGKVWGLSLGAVGLGSIAFHTTSGDARIWGRKADYWAIALSSISLTRCLFPTSRSGLTAAAFGASTVNPLAVSTVNAVAMEAKYLARARDNPELHRHHQSHLASVLVGVGLFIAEEFYPHAPIIHSLWHCASAWSVATTNYLLDDLEGKRGYKRRRSSVNPNVPPTVQPNIQPGTH